MQNPALSNLAPRNAARSSAAGCFFDGVEERGLFLLLSPKISVTDFLDDAGAGDRDRDALFSLLNTFARLHMIGVTVTEVMNCFDE